MHEIAAVREAWLDAVRRADADAIAPLVAEDVLVVHPNGRCSSGRAAVVEEYRVFFEHHSSEQHFTASETVVDRDWAFERGTMVTTVTCRASGEQRQVTSHVLSRRPRRSYWTTRWLLLIVT